MKKHKVLLVEDAAFVEVALHSRLVDLGFDIVAVNSKPDQVIDTLEKEDVDIVLMDLFLSEKSTGIDIANEISKKMAIPVILLCGEDNIDQAQLTKALAFSLQFKPLKDAELVFNINAAVRIHQGNIKEDVLLAMKSKSYIFVRADYRLNKIRVNDIYYLEAKKDYVIIHTSDNVYTVHATMKDMVRVLPDDLFIRTHRSYIVNIDKVFSIKYPDLIIEGKMKTIQIGGLYRKSFFEKINII
jgi:DNA-binding LytR/AlgR family response regulator